MDNDLTDLNRAVAAQEPVELAQEVPGVHQVPVGDPGDVRDPEMTLGNPEMTLEDPSADEAIQPFQLDPLHVGPEEPEVELDQAWLEKAHDELQEKPKWRARDIQALREMVQGTPIDIRLVYIYIQYEYIYIFKARLT